MENKNIKSNNLELCGEQINLINRLKYTEESKKLNRFRPQSALYTSSKNIHEFSRRPFSAGTEPSSPKLHSFLRTSQTCREGNCLNSNKNSEYFKDIIPIPGTVDSMSTFNEDFVHRQAVNGVRNDSHSRKTNHTFKCGYDNVSENGSVDTCISLGTKIKAIAQNSEKPSKNNFNSGAETRSSQFNWVLSSEKFLVPEKDYNNKEENTSSGISSSSDVQNAAINQETVDKNQWSTAFSDRLKTDVKKSENLTGRVSFGKTSQSEQYTLSNDPLDYYSTFNSQLSLVEEESSQDSDISSKYLSLYLNSPKNDTNRSNPYKVRDQKQTINDEDENEMKFKALEEKYRSEMIHLRSGFNDLSDDVAKIGKSIEISSENECRRNSAKEKRSSISLADDKMIKDKHNIETVLENDYMSVKSKNGNTIDGEVSTSIPKIIISGADTSTSINDGKMQNNNREIEIKDYESDLPASPLNYPTYLEQNDSKSYTSKVIEEYKKEIDEINNFHSLAIKDLRKKCDELKSYTSPNSPTKSNKCLVSSSEEEEEEIENVISKEKKSEEQPLTREIKSADDVHVKVKSKIKTYKTKTKRKPAKKEQKSENKIFKKNGNDKKIQDVGKKGIIKFKAQKITFSRSTTKYNHTYVDRDKDIISWMSSRVETPLADDSSCENVKVNQNLVHFDDEIVPAAKKQSEASEVELCKNIEDESFPESFEGNSEENDFDFDTDKMIDIENNLRDINSERKIVPEIMTVKDKSDEINDCMTAEYNDIIHFLEKVEKSANEDNASLIHNQPPFALKVEELMELTKGELAHRVVVSTLAAGKAATSAAGFKSALLKAAKVYAARLKATKAVGKQQAALAMAQSSQALQRHQKFIEQLVDEKKSLTERIEQLARTAASAEAKRTRAARTAAERLQLELRNQKQRLVAAHQRDKQTWLKHHTQKIKEMTVKGLENELQDIEHNHTQQIIKIHQENEKAMSELREQHNRELRKIKDESIKNLEDELDKERLLAAERLEQKRLEWEAMMKKTMERADQEAWKATQKSEESIKNIRIQNELWKTEQEKELFQKMKLMEKQIENKKASMMDEISQMKEKMLHELEIYKDEFHKKQTMFLKEKEMEMRAAMKRDRDIEIEKAIDAMELEAQIGRKETQETIRRIKEKYENDIYQLEESEKGISKKYNELRDQLRNVQELYAASQITITQLEGKLRQANELNLQNEAHTNMLLRATEMKSNEKEEDFKMQLNNLKEQHKEEMHQLFAKVKVVVAKKDDAVILAKKEVANLRERCVKLEARLTP